MSILCIVLALTSVLAVIQPASANAAVPEATSEAKMTMASPPYTEAQKTEADFHAAWLAEQAASANDAAKTQAAASPDGATSAPVTAAPSPQVEVPKQEAPAGDAQMDAAAKLEMAKAEVAKLEAQAKLEAAKAEVARLEAAAQASNPAQASTATSDAQTPSAVAPETPNPGSSAAEASQPAGVTLLKPGQSEQQAEANFHASWLAEQAAQANADVSTQTTPATPPAARSDGLNVRRAEEKSEADFHAAWLAEQASNSASEAKAPAAEPTDVAGQERSGAGLNVRKVDEAAQKSEADFHAAWLAEQAAGSGTEVPQDASKADAASRPKFTLKSPEATTQDAQAEDPEAKLAERRAEVEDFFGLSRSKKTENAAENATSNATNSASTSSKSKSKTVTMHDMPHYRNHGAAFAHVEPAPRKSAQPKETKQTKSRAAVLAEARAEVEDFFHLHHSKPSTPEESSEEQPVGMGRKLIRCFFVLAALCSIAGIGYSKYESICQMTKKGKDGLSKFKAKQEDSDDFTQPPRFAQSGSVMGSTARRGLSRRDMGSSDFGV